MIDPNDCNSLEQFYELQFGGEQFSKEMYECSAKVRITADAAQVEATLNNTLAAQDMIAALAIRATANTWGDEIFFGLPGEVEVDDEFDQVQEVVDMGDLGYWPPGRAFRTFFGPTPASRGNEIRPASAVIVIG